jgi:UDP-glucose 4-epimerase
VSSSPTCLVTGAAGFIGSHLVDQLLAVGYRVIGVDSLVLGKRENLAKAFEARNFVFKELDINDDEAFLHFIKAEVAASPVETVWHLAANSDIPAGVNDPQIDFSRTFLTTFNVLRAMHALRIPQLCFASTSAIYGDLDKVLTEDTGPLFPISNYGAMKLASEGIISAALERYLQRAWIFRFPNVVGPRATHGAIYDFIRKLKANPKNWKCSGMAARRSPTCT